MALPNNEENLQEVTGRLQQVPSLAQEIVAVISKVNNARRGLGFFDEGNEQKFAKYTKELIEFRRESQNLMREYFGGKAALEEDSATATMVSKAA